MSGHNKWSTIKRKKGAADAKRGQIFTKIAKEITLAAKGGGDPDSNPALRTAIDKAKAANMPKDNVEKALKKGTGELPGVVYEEYLYEGYAPKGIALMMMTITDNKNRTTSEIRHILSKYGGNLGEDGCVAWNFDKKGQVFVKKESSDEDTVMDIIIEAGGEDLKTEDDGYYITCDYKDLFVVADAIKQKDIAVESAEIIYIAQNLVSIDENNTKKVLRVLSLLDDLDDVANIFSNLDIPDDMDLEEE
ncbi:YebC/PmpR family DNA-binding transcriptional regulator [Candidatus Calescamantes bacterium]|nr:YebC/PmpR family DNA-binding transcriptional regulator [Candidatus Calescamantes bacterium]MCK5598539.1 YebC/PmpR family DNA-binding transcriptional regulator [bacterium]